MWVSADGRLRLALPRAQVHRRRGFEAFVWHDGEFPFSEAGRSPTHLHHCGAEQFITFGQFVRSIGPQCAK